MNHHTRLPLIEPDVRISRIRLSEAVRRFASFFPVGSMVRHPMQAVSFPQLLAGVLGRVARSDFRVFFPQPSSNPRLHVPFQLGEHSRAVPVMNVSRPPSHSLIDPSNDLLGFLP